MNRFGQMKLLEKKSEREGLDVVEGEWLKREFRNDKEVGVSVVMGGILFIAIATGKDSSVVVSIVGSVIGFILMLGGVFFYAKTSYRLDRFAKVEKERQERRTRRVGQDRAPSQDTIKPTTDIKRERTTDATFTEVGKMTQEPGNISVVEVARVEEIIGDLQSTHQELADAVNQAMRQGFHDVQESSESWWGNRNLQTVLSRQTANFQHLAAKQGAIQDYIAKVNGTLDSLTEFYKRTGQANRLSLIEQKRAALDHAKLDADTAEQKARKAKAEQSEREAKSPPLSPEQQEAEKVFAQAILPPYLYQAFERLAWSIEQRKQFVKENAHYIVTLIDDIEVLRKQGFGVFQAAEQLHARGHLITTEGINLLKINAQVKQAVEVIYQDLINARREVEKEQVKQKSPIETAEQETAWLERKFAEERERAWSGGRYQNEGEWRADVITHFKERADEVLEGYEERKQYWEDALKKRGARV